MFWKPKNDGISLNTEVTEILNIVTDRTNHFLEKSCRVQTPANYYNQSYSQTCKYHEKIKSNFKEFLEDFIDVHFLLSAASCEFPALVQSIHVKANLIIKHVCKELDYVLENGKILLLIHKDIIDKSADLDFFLRVVQIASIYDIEAFLHHPVVQAILTDHGMKTIHDDVLYACAAPVVYLLYPFFYYFQNTKAFILQHTVAQFLPIHSILFNIPLFIFNMYLDISNDENVGHRILKMYLLVFWLSFSSQEISQWCAASRWFKVFYATLFRRDIGIDFQSFKVNNKNISNWIEKNNEYERQRLLSLETETLQSMHHRSSIIKIPNINKTMEHRLQKLAGETYTIYRNTSYLSDFWNKVDCIIILTLGVYFLHEYFQLFGRYISIVAYSIAIMLLITRSMEYFGLFVQHLGLFIVGFTRIFDAMLYFIAMIVVIAVAVGDSLLLFHFQS